ncbi:Protein translocase subunit SecE [Hyella patelloides LEGE 07179]|uniref:Protein translocase subunit SecE n=1 Tax=Hyella patelloides LEGE 07179 TaxID=945734 RepID=A0A563W4A4_9CYAN|nr:preprotein translocase subunit SecE [Hyella patelloides]VEP18529.1 Protein translocase subunit SecE [Hyella patelloides LEGE 07179]
MAKKEAVKKTVVNTKETGDNSSLNKFVDETKEELTKVVWPSRQQLLSESAAVLSMVVLVSLVIYLVDNLFSWGSGRIF